MKDYLTLLKFVLENGAERDDRTGVGTLSTFGERLAFDLSKGLPVVTTKNSFALGDRRVTLVFKW